MTQQRTPKKDPPMRIDDLGMILPQAQKIEAAVLGALMLEENTFLMVNQIISLDSFYNPSHNTIFKAIQELSELDLAYNILTVTERLKSQKQLTDVGGAVFIAKLINNIASTSRIEEWALILREKEIARKQIDFANQLCRLAYDETKSPIETNGFIADEAYKISSLLSIQKEYTNADLVHMVLKNVEKAAEEKGITGVPTDFTEIDRLIGGLQNSDMIVLAARPSMGKTALAICMMVNAALHNGKRVAFFSLEMSAEQLMKRVISIYTGYTLNQLNKGVITPEEWTDLTNKVEGLMGTNIILVDDCLTMPSIRYRCKKERLKAGIDLVIIDYLQLIEGDGWNRENEVSAISRSTKLLAKELSVPIIALSQLSRAVESRPGKIPQLSDLRESGSIEQDADIVAFLYRAWYYDIQEDENGESTFGKALLMVQKHRNGALQNIELKFISDKTEFTNPDTEYNHNSAVKPSTDFEAEHPEEKHLF